MIVSNDKERSQIDSAIRTEWVGNIEKTYMCNSLIGEVFVQTLVVAQTLAW